MVDLEGVEGKKIASLSIDWLFSHAWAVQPQVLDTMFNIATRNLSDFSAVLANKDKRVGYEQHVRGNIGIVNIIGPLFARAGFFEMISGATDLGMLVKSFSALVDDPNIQGIVLNIDSPGGEVSGTSEFGTMITEARKKKPVYAYVQGSGASGAYWLASSVGPGNLFLADTAAVGSIGVVMGYRSDKERNEKAGIKDIEIVSSQSPDKRLDPTTDEGRGKVQVTVDDIARVFVNTVAKNRGVTAEKVLSDFGKGWVLVGEEAVRVGMADGVGTFESVIAKMQDKIKTGGFSMSGTEEKPKTFSQKELDDAKVAAKAEGVAEGKTLGHAEGVAQENARIKSIEELDSPEAKTIVAENKFKTDMTKEKVSVMVLDAQKAKREAGLKARIKDGELPNADAALPEGSEVPKGDGMKLDVKAAADAGNAHLRTR
jgi:signal peptide peptidase SppA